MQMSEQGIAPAESSAMDSGGGSDCSHAIHVYELPPVAPRHSDNSQADGNPSMDTGNLEVSGDLV